MNFDIVSRQLLQRIMLYGGEIRCDDGFIRKEKSNNLVIYKTMFCTWNKGGVKRFDPLYSGIDVDKAIEEFISIIGPEQTVHIALNWFREYKQKEAVIDV